MSSGKMLTVKTSDGELFEIEEVVAIQCQSLKHIVEDDCRPSTIPVQVHSKTLTKVIEYCKKHADLTLDSKDLKKFDSEFVDVDQAVLYDLLMAANFLEIKDLLDQICDQVAKMIRGRTPEEIRKTFNIENDFTPKEEEEIRRQNSWAFE